MVDRLLRFGIVFFSLLIVTGRQTASADFPTSGVIISPPNAVEIIDFSQVPLNPITSFETGTITVSISLVHSVSGQISGRGEVAVAGSYQASGFPITSKARGRGTFTAKPVKRGSIVTLQGAKIETTMLGFGDVKIATLGYFRATMATTFSYRSLNATITEAGAQWTGSLSKGKFPVTGSMTLYGKKYNMNGYVPYHHRDSNGQMVDIGGFPTGVLPSDSVMGLYVKINSALQNPKGAIAGVAGGILDSREEPTGSNYDQRGAYKLVGARSPVTKISKLTFSGIGGNAGSSVVVHVDDSLNVQQGVGFANSLKAFGYNISF